jgi:hypothetical protein
MIRVGSLFSQILSLFQRPNFARHVRELKAGYRAREFTSWERFVAMLFCQLAQACSLREISDGLKSFGKTENAASFPRQNVASHRPKNVTELSPSHK